MCGLNRKWMQCEEFVCIFPLSVVTVEAVPVCHDTHAHRHP